MDEQGPVCESCGLPATDTHPFRPKRGNYDFHYATVDCKEALQAALASERGLAKAVVFRANAMISGIGQWMDEGDGYNRCVACRAPVTGIKPRWHAHHEPGCAVVELSKAIAAYEGRADEQR